MKLCVITLLLLTAAVARAQSNQSTDPDDRTNVSKTGSITGRVVTETGEPLADAVVSLRGYTSRESYNAITDRDGKFRFSGLSPIVYLASANSPAYTAALGLTPTQVDQAKRYVDAYLWLTRPWMYNQASPYQHGKALAAAQSTPFAALY